MSIFRTNKYSLKKSWSFSQLGNLWRIFITSNDILIGETRNLEEKIVYFFSIDLNSGNHFFKNYLFENGNYWVSIEGYNAGNIYLHRFENPNLPEHNGIIDIDIKTGEVRWENKDVMYFFNTENEIYGHKQQFESFKYYNLNPENGLILNEVPAENQLSLFELKQDTIRELYINNYYTEIFNLLNSDSTFSQIIILEMKGKDIFGEVEFIHFENYLTFNYHIKKVNLKDLSNPNLENVLCVYDIKNRIKLYSDILNVEASYNVPDSYFVHKNYLIYIKEKKHIVTLKLI